MRQAAHGASDPSLGADARGALNSRFRSDLAKINAVVAQASSGGVNLIDGSVSGSLQAPAGGGSTVTLTGANLSVGGPLIGLTDDASLADPAQAASAAATLETAIGAVGQAVSQLSVQSQAIDGHLSVLAQASLTASPGVAAAVNPNLDEDGARLQALQVLQQLQAGGGAATSQAPQSILALFR
jgi:flagellin